MVQVLLERARRQLDPRRMAHTLGVTHTVTALAALHEIDLTDAALAGLLHDLSKEIPHDQLLDDLRRMGYEIHPDDLEHPSTWHGLHAAAVARRELGLDGSPILEAVQFHTTADAGVGPLAKALFIADLCEPNRKVKEAPEILDVARQDLEEGFRRAIVHKLSHVVSQKKKLHPRAVRALKAYAGLEPRQLPVGNGKK